MAIQEIVIGGTLKPDGALELDHKPDLAPGRVTVVLRQEAPAAAPAPAEEGWWPCMQRIRARLEASGASFMDEEEMNAYIAWMREDDDRIERIYQEMGKETPRQENA